MLLFTKKLLLYRGFCRMIPDLSFILYFCDSREYIHTDTCIVFFFASWGSLIRFRIMANSGMLLGSHTLPSRVSTDILKLRCSRHRVENVRHWSNIIRIRPKILHNTHSQCGGREWVPAFFCLKMISVFPI